MIMDKVVDVKGGGGGLIHPLMCRVIQSLFGLDLEDLQKRSMAVGQ